MSSRRPSRVVPFRPSKRRIARRQAARIHPVFQYVAGAIAIVSASVIGTVAWHERDRIPTVPMDLMSDQQPEASWSYPSCSAARAADAAPIRAGEPGYGPHLDRDRDGVACEPYFGKQGREVGKR